MSLRGSAGPRILLSAWLEGQTGGDYLPPPVLHFRLKGPKENMKKPYDPERAKVERARREKENLYWVTRIKRMRRTPSAYSYRAILAARIWCDQQIAWMDHSLGIAQSTGESARIPGILYRRAKLEESKVKLDLPLAYHRDQYNTLRRLVVDAAELIWSVEEEEGDTAVPEWKRQYQEYVRADQDMSEADGEDGE